MLGRAQQKRSEGESTHGADESERDQLSHGFALMVQTVRVADGRSVAYADGAMSRECRSWSCTGRRGSRPGRPPDEERMRGLGIRRPQVRIPEAT